ncbi:MAG: helix-turn-helix domain-containing protein [Spirochaetes bacterium]|nr:helix-turn-helix domain-containing protein [Spirochaetota bacterium]
MKKIRDTRNYLNLTQRELADRLSVEEITIIRYESGKMSPAFSNIIQLADIFQISIDFLLSNENINYPRNLKLLKLAKQLDILEYSDSRNTIENTAKSLLGSKRNASILIKQDLIEVELTDNFNSNLKQVRNYRAMTQNELAKKIGVSRATLGMYEVRNHPPIEKLIKLSEILDISIHALATGNKLKFNFTDGIFGETILFADRFLSLEHQKILITLMETILQNQPTTV